MDEKKLESLTPRQAVVELDKYIVGQPKAKRALAVALRNRYRRQLVPKDFRDEITPKNILMIGPTGVGKTELARRLAKLADVPFIKVEATKFTEVGYVGRDVESIVRDLIDTAVNMVQEARQEEVRSQAEGLATEKLITYLVTSLDGSTGDANENGVDANHREPRPAVDAKADGKTEVKKVVVDSAKLKRRRKAVAKMLAEQKLEEHIVEIELEPEDGAWPAMEFSAGMSSDDMSEAFQDFVTHMHSQRKRSRQLPVKEARRLLIQEESNKLVDWDQVVDSAIEKVEQGAIVFIDEIDKIVSRGNEIGPDVSGEGVQRDLLPIVEGSSVSTRYGPVKTDHILFVGAGAFGRVKPSDLIPELQGRFPIRVELDTLTYEDFVTILTQPNNALTKQYQALLKMENVELEFSEDGLKEMARVAWEMNERMENIGARRLHTIVEKVLEDLNFTASERSGDTVVVDKAFVLKELAAIAANPDLSRYIL
ncbi:MAG TPA: ATP-dependent protease ATPase subunit HslU [Chloroflexota bacterium]|nr:ATP-dependent protease ATPase subunit HslU [Chloroflexota bacterium]